MEVRGIGIIDVAKVSDWQYPSRKASRPCCYLEGLAGGDEVDRIGLDRDFTENLALKVPARNIPVRDRPGTCAFDRGRGDG